MSQNLIVAAYQYQKQLFKTPSCKESLFFPGNKEYIYKRRVVKMMAYTENEFIQVCYQAGHADKEKSKNYIENNPKEHYNFLDIMEISKQRDWLCARKTGHYFGGKYNGGGGPVRTTKRYAPYHG